MLMSLVYLQKGNVKKFKKLMEIVQWNFQDKKQGLYILSKTYSFGKTTEGVKLTSWLSLFRVRIRLWKLELKNWKCNFFLENKHTKAINHLTPLFHCIWLLLTGAICKLVGFPKKIVLCIARCYIFVWNFCPFSK